MTVIEKLERANRVRKTEGYYSLLYKTFKFTTKQIERKANEQIDRPRPHYHFGARLAGKQAENLGYNKVCLIEFGVAGGNGLVALEKIVEDLEEEFDISYEIYGFDLGSGLPSPESYKDCPYFFDRGHYEMDVELLQSELSRAELVLGDVDETVSKFISTYNPAPIGAVYFDLDYYSSTKDALKILDVSDKHILPRVPMYFDDILDGQTLKMTIPQIAVQEAIKEYNKDKNQECIGKLRIDNRRYNEIRPQRQYAYHRFHHNSYTEYIGKGDRQLPLDIE